MNEILQQPLRFRWLWWLIGFWIAAFVTTTSLMPSKNLPNVNLSDKVEHALAYALLAFWFASLVLRRSFIWVALGLLALGGAIEIIQGMMPYGREGDWYDFYADAAGIALGLMLASTRLGLWLRWVESLFLRATR
jgi:hypothetical protein